MQYHGRHQQLCLLGKKESMLEMELRECIQEFLEMLGKPVHEFNDQIWLSDLGIMADITMHINILNKQMQHPDNLIHSLYDIHFRKYLCLL